MKVQQNDKIKLELNDSELETVKKSLTEYIRSKDCYRFGEAVTLYSNLEAIQV